jgi:hypothetical protein
MTRAADGRKWYEYTGCNTAIAGDLPMTIGMSDVAGSSFHQVGPSNIPPPPPNVVKPLDQSMLTSSQAAIVPWQFIVGEHVKRNIGGVLSRVESLSRTEIEAIFSRTVTDWRQLGLATDVGAPGVVDVPSPITLCLRYSVSGSKAAFDETVMKDATEFPVQTVALTSPADGVLFGQSTQDVQDCIRGNAGNGRPAHPRGIGYVDADVSVDTLPGYPIKLNGLWASNIIVAGQSTGGNTNVPTVTLNDTTQTHSSNNGAVDILRDKFTPGALVGNLVVITGGTGVGQSRTITANTSNQLELGAVWATIPDNTSSYKIVPDTTDSKVRVRCGQYLYWAGERMNVRSYADPGVTAAMSALNTAFITNSSTSGTIALLPAGQFWVAGSDMYVTKNADAGPVIWKAGYPPAGWPCAQ